MFARTDIIPRSRRQLWEHYLSSAKTVSDSLLTELAERLELPPPAVSGVTGQNVFNDTFQVGGLARECGRVVSGRADLTLVAVTAQYTLGRN